VSAEFAITIRPARIGIGGEWTPADGRWREVREVSDRGALLVRPDNHVAWRCADGADQPADVLRSAVKAILGR
jgi:2,4-dichlorophenol 6-monooxygenase